MKEKIPFNSHVNAKTQQILYKSQKSKTFKYKVDYEKTDKPYSSHIHCSDIVTDKFTLLPKYRFYQTHEFHKLLNNLLKNKAFSVFQQTLTICKNLINNLYH